jgi:hypothetical protein
MNGSFCLHNRALRGPLALAGIAALAALGAYGQEIDTYAGPGFNSEFNDGDLILAFFSSSDTLNGGQGDLLFNLGSANSFAGLAAGTYSVAGFNGSTVTGQGAPGFGNNVLTHYPSGSLTVPSTSTYWTVMGADSNGASSAGVSNELWLTATAAPKPLSSSGQQTIAQRVSAIGSAGANDPNADGSAYDSAQTTGNYLIPSGGRWTGITAVADNTVSANSDSLTLYSLVPGASGATELGVFTLTDKSGAESLTFTAPQSQPSEPPSSAARLVNISSRADVGKGSGLEIAGFVVSGPPGSTEQVLLRGVGPTLSQFGVAGALMEPILTLLDSAGTQVATNAGWSSAPNASEIAAVTAATGAFALPSGSADSAILVNLAPGAYTAEIDGANGATGVALAEIYEVSSEGAELINISTRASVGTGSDVEIGGFVISGSQPETVLIRAVGPTLSEFGVAGALEEPSLSVMDSLGNTVAANTGWSNNSDASTIASESETAGAFALPVGSADCALLLTLSPGAYTAVVSGANGAIGVALVEVYEVP